MWRPPRGPSAHLFRRPVALGTAAILLCDPVQPSFPYDPGGLQITYSSVLLAILVGILHAGLAPAVVMGGVKPNLVLVAVVLVTTSFGFSAGITWAFLAGLVANLLIPEPPGSIPVGPPVVAPMGAGGGQLPRHL